MAVEIPINKSDLYWTQQNEFDGVTYDLRFRYNLRMDRFILDFIGITEGIILLNHDGAESDIGLLDQVKHLDLPQGKLFIHDKEKKDNQPTLEFFGDTVVLAYE